MFKLELSTENAAFEDDACAEIARILRNLANTLDRGMKEGETPLRDMNGNTVGKVTWPND